MSVRPVPQYSTEPVGLMIYENGALADPDGNIVTLKIVNTDTSAVLVAPGTPAIREQVGKYNYTLTSANNAVLGNYTITWSYTYNGNPSINIDSYQVVGPMPYWQMLTFDERQMAINVFNRIDKGFDSTVGGPYLQDLKQSSFNAYEEVAFVMLTETIDYINYEFQPVFQPAYELGVSSMAPFPTNWYGVLASQSYAMMLKHVARQYIEQPTPEGMNAAWLNRRDYYDRWMELYKIEKEISDKQLRQMKRAFMVGSKRSMLVAGGLIPRMFINPARPHFMYAAANMS